MKQLVLGVTLGILIILGITFRYSKIDLAINKRTNFKGYICWATPTKEVLEKCRKEGSCSGAGVFAWHLRRIHAEKLAIKKCNREFGKGACYLDYCNRRK
jgi:hypothetical protein